MIVRVGSNDTRAATALEVASGGARAVVRPGHPVVIGRDASCDLVVDHRLVSRRHAEVDWTADGWVLRDLNSRNGTFVDGQRAAYVAATDGGEVRLGSLTDGPLIEFDLVEDHASAAPAPLDPAAVAAAESVAPALAARVPAAEHDATGLMRIGRDPTNDIVLSDLRSSRNHAEVRRVDGGFEVVDLGSRNGTFHNGQRIARATLKPGDLVSIGRHDLIFDGQLLHEFVDTGPVSLVADDLSVSIGKRKLLLDDVSFALAEGSLLAVIGPSGCGKSTLLRAVTGLRPATQGTVKYDGRDLYADYAELRYRIGLVPQDDVLHRQLTVRRALRFAAALRFADDVPRSERRARVDEVLETLNLTDRAKQRIDTLSGGQRKRVSVALELLTEPSLLFLDEPTSGLDPALDKEVMEELRELADRGRTVIVVTHNVLHLDICDRVLVMCSGGRMGYFGPPSELLDFFGAQDYAEVFGMITKDADRWATAYRTSEHYVRYVQAEVVPSVAASKSFTGTSRLPAAPVGPGGGVPGGGVPGGGVPGGEAPALVVAAPTRPVRARRAEQGAAPGASSGVPAGAGAPGASPAPAAGSASAAGSAAAAAAGAARPAPAAAAAVEGLDAMAPTAKVTSPRVAPADQTGAAAAGAGTGLPAPAVKVPQAAPYAAQAARVEGAQAAPSAAARIEAAQAARIAAAPAVASPAVPAGRGASQERVVGRAKVNLGGVSMRNSALHPSAPVRQFLTLCLRMMWVIAADRGYSLFLIGLPCALALLVHTVPGGNGLAPALANFNLEAERLLVVLVVGAAFLGTAAAIREIVNEATIYKRERAVGLSAGAYLASKVAVFALIICVQTALFTWLSLLGKKQAADPLIFTNHPLLEIMIPVALVALASMTVGLLVSALARTSEQTTPVLVVLVMAQLVLCGGLFELNGQVVMEQLAWLFPTRWGMAAGASTVDLQRMIPISDPLWNHTVGDWWRSVLLLLAQMAVLIGLTRLALRRLEPGRE